MRTYPGRGVAGHVSDVQILITGYVTREMVVRGYVQPIIDRTAYAAPVRRKAAGSHVGCALCARSGRSAGQRLYIFDVRIAACSTTIVGTHPVIVSRIRTQPGHGITGRVADVQILITGYVGGEIVTCGYVQPITGRTVYGAPVGDKAAKRDIGCGLCARSRRRRAGRRRGGCRGSRRRSCGCGRSRRARCRCECSCSCSCSCNCNCSCGRGGSGGCWSKCRSSCSCWCRRRCSTRHYRVALRARGRAANAVTEVLRKGGIVSLHTGSGRRAAVIHLPVDHVKTSLPLVQSQLEAGSAAPRVVLVAPLDVKDSVWGSATNRGEDPIPGIHRVQVVPVRHDGVVVRGPRHTEVTKGGIYSGELSVAVG